MDDTQPRSDLRFQARYTFQATIEAVFDALWAQPGGTLLEVRQIVGAPLAVGFQQQARYAHGGVDLLMIETVTRATRPTHLRVTQQPDGLTRHDPAERDIPFLESLATDLDAKFAQDFGADPAMIQIDFHLSDEGPETHVQIVISVLTDDRVGWLRRRRWRKSAAKDAVKIASGIADRLQVQ